MPTNKEKDHPWGGHSKNGSARALASVVGAEKPLIDVYAMRLTVSTLSGSNTLRSATGWVCPHSSLGITVLLERPQVHYHKQIACTR